MRAAGFDPYRAEQRLLWRNRIAQWCAQPAQSAWHALALLALLIVLLPIARQALHEARQALEWLMAQQALPLAISLVVLLSIAQQEADRRLQRRLARSWLAAQPVSARCKARMVWRHRAGRAVGYALAGHGLLGMQAPLSMHAAWLGIVVGATLFAALWASQPRSLPRPRPTARSAVLRPRGRGSLWRWQVAEAGASLAPRSLAWALLVILLVPRGPAVMAAIALLLVLLVVLAHAWVRAVRVLPAAQRWLGAEPLPPRRLLLGCLPYPLLLLSIVTLCLVGLAFAFGNPLLGWMAALGLPAFGSLHWLSVAAHRQRPARAALELVAQSTFLLGLLQALPLLAPLVWLGQMVWLWRRSLRG